MSFRNQLEKNIRQTIARLKKDGTTATSVRCLQQIVPPPSSGLPDAPRGTNCQWVYSQLFSEVCREKFASFTYDA